MRKQKLPDAIREKMVAQFEQKAIEAYSKIITRYPATDRVGDAKHRLEALKAPIPQPTPEALAQSKAEEASRGKIKLVTKIENNFKKHPDVAMAAQTGEPNLNDETVKSAPAMVNGLTAQIQSMQAGKEVGIQAVGTGTGTPGPNEKAPGSQTPETTEGAPPSPAPAQVNEIQKPTGEGVDVTQAPASGTTKAGKVDKKQESSSKKKKKKGLGKLNPF
jgi:outer membrane protein assembly factor BamD